MAGLPLHISVVSCLWSIQSSPHRHTKPLLGHPLPLPLPEAPIGWPIGHCPLARSLTAPGASLPALHYPHSRIYEILPQRIQQWQQSPCIAEEHGKKLLERIRREQQSARTRLQEMERRFHELEAIILRAKQQAVREDEEVRKQESGRGPAMPCLASSLRSPRAEHRE